LFIECCTKTLTLFCVYDCCVTVIFYSYSLRPIFVHNINHCVLSVYCFKETTSYLMQVNSAMKEPAYKISFFSVFTVANLRLQNVRIYLPHFKGPFIATQLNSTQHRVVDTFTAYCHLSMNVVTQLTQFVGYDVINENTTDLAGCTLFNWVS